MEKREIGTSQRVGRPDHRPLDVAFEVFLEIRYLGLLSGPTEVEADEEGGSQSHYR